MTKGGVRLEILLNATTRRNEHGNIIGMVGEYCVLFVAVLCTSCDTHYTHIAMYLSFFSLKALVR
jgi:hypothetical protein